MTKLHQGHKAFLSLIFTIIEHISIPYDQQFPFNTWLPYTCSIKII